MEGILYSGWLEEDSMHSINRAKERSGMSKRKAVNMMRLARERGITSDKCTWSLDREFLESRTDDTAIAVAFNGYCFIMQRETMHCITMFKLPKRFGQKKTFYNKSKRQMNNIYLKEFAS